MFYKKEICIFFIFSKLFKIRKKIYFKLRCGTSVVVLAVKNSRVLTDECDDAFSRKSHSDQATILAFQSVKIDYTVLKNITTMAETLPIVNCRLSQKIPCTPANFQQFCLYRFFSSTNTTRNMGSTRGVTTVNLAKQCKSSFLDFNQNLMFACYFNFALILVITNVETC